MNKTSTVNLVVGGIVATVIILVIAATLLAVLGKDLPQVFAFGITTGLGALGAMLANTRSDASPALPSPALPARAVWASPPGAGRRLAVVGDQPGVDLLATLRAETCGLEGGDLLAKRA